ncbi:hypothetical protein ACFSW8_01295 [Rubritalea tangerina]|uniref:Uncharacterized protein n=2 Tax=Rubritalea tangerina TaxID=430798 RepID=A0ABW4Z743_9BACT
MSSPAENTTKVTKEAFKQWRNARRGSKQAQDMTNPFWVYCVQKELNAYQANAAFDGPSSFAYKPCWSYERFGMSETKLEDGRTILIAGEHEDYYDPDFFIYNDVIVKDANGKVQIFGYSEDIFPATDFHSATLVGNRIYIIGSLGYTDRRKEKDTPVYYLDLKDYTIHQVNSGQGPGWVFEHEAIYDSETHSITIDWGKRWIDSGDIIDNFSKWQLKLDTKQWTLVEERPWSQFRFSRKDGESNLLFDVRLDMPPIDASTFEDPDTPMDQETKEKKQKTYSRRCTRRKSKHSSRPIKKPWTNSIDLASPTLFTHKPRRRTNIPVSASQSMG